MRISLYSSPACWLIVPADIKPTEAGNQYGPLQFEGTVPSQLIPEEVRTHLLSQCEAHAFATVSEDLALTLMDQTLSRYGTLALPPLEDREVV